MQRLDSENERREIAWVWDGDLLLERGNEVVREEEKCLFLFLAKKSVKTVLPVWYIARSLFKGIRAVLSKEFGTISPSYCLNVTCLLTFRCVVFDSEKDSFIVEAIEGRKKPHVITC